MISDKKSTKRNTLVKAIKYFLSVELGRGSQLFSPTLMTISMGMIKESSVKDLLRAFFKAVTHVLIQKEILKILQMKIEMRLLRSPQNTLIRA
eukprot:CAMPEP_0197017896 /NCGR_PEP_ID=MMETSP1380-20130617/79796_1 /TAXON_ID=5936 /ORGANISM="Euplotes crassus, Strain CT5" /LENGTH=92 /DNA_ID=CAMNT_0042445051 /DNA_START=267 /DNA_END=545 /DNA_ORIENTATION=+